MLDGEITIFSPSVSASFVDSARLAEKWSFRLQRVSRMSVTIWPATTWQRKHGEKGAGTLTVGPPTRKRDRIREELEEKKIKERIEPISLVMLPAGKGRMAARCRREGRLHALPTTRSPRWEKPNEERKVDSWFLSRVLSRSSSWYQQWKNTLVGGVVLCKSYVCFSPSRGSHGDPSPGRRLLYGMGDHSPWKFTRSTCASLVYIHIKYERPPHFTFILLRRIRRKTCRFFHIGLFENVPLFIWVFSSSKRVPFFGRLIYPW